MIAVTPWERLGRFDNDWLSARYHFSFGEFRDPALLGWGALGVWNDDRVKAGGGFGMHPHRDMEIVTFMRKGVLTHRDSLGNEGHIAAGEVQAMSAGTGIVHSERNEAVGDAELFQIWIEPRAKGLTPRWSQARIAIAERPGEIVTLASGRANRGEALEIAQDASVLAVDLPRGQRARHVLEPGRRVYLVPTRGAIAVNDQRLDARGGAAVEGVNEIELRAIEDSEIVIVDVT
ncbi:MAG: pirin family protein [Alphaproteobacteria bacterium]